MDTGPVRLPDHCGYWTSVAVGPIWTSQDGHSEACVAISCTYRCSGLRDVPHLVEKGLSYRIHMYLGYDICPAVMYATRRMYSTVECVHMPMYVFTGVV